MANPQLPHISESEQNLLYSKLSEYNRGRASFKEAGTYLLVLPRPQRPNYSLWFFSPTLEKQSILYIHDLAPDIHESLRIASTMLYFSRRCIAIVEYNEKHMQSQGDDIIAFGKYHGHYLHEIMKIDPSYLAWIAYKYVPKIPKQERFVRMAEAYYSVHLDLMLRRTRQNRQTGRYLGVAGERLKDLELTVERVKLEDDPYKTRVQDRQRQFYVKQILTLADASGNLAVYHVASRNYSSESGKLPALEHAYQPGELIHIAAATVLRTYEIRGNKYTRLTHVKLQKTQP